MASLEYLTQNSLTAYPFKRSQPAGVETNQPIQDNWFYDILFVSYSPSIRQVYVSFIEKTATGDLHIQFNNSENFTAVGGLIVIPSEEVINHLQNKLTSFTSHSNELFSVKFVIGEGLVQKEAFTQAYTPKEAELASGAIILSSPKLFNLAIKTYSSEILEGGELLTSVNEVNNFSASTYSPLIKLRSNIEASVEGTSIIELIVAPGTGTGLYDNCPQENEIDDVYTISNVHPNPLGAFFINPAICHSLNTLSENDRVYYTAANLLDAYDPEIIISNHSLLLENHCKSKCPREHINAFAHYLNRVGDGLNELNEIVFNSIETRGKGTPSLDVFNATDFCVESTDEDIDPFQRCGEHTEPIDTYIGCRPNFRKYYHEFRTLQIFYNDSTVRNFTILEVIDDNSVRLDNPPTAGSFLWFRVKDNGVVSNLNCATAEHNLMAEENKNPYFKIKYTSSEAYDSEGNYVTLIGVTVAIFNPAKEGVLISANFHPTGLLQKGSYKIRKEDSINDSNTAQVFLNCRDYAFIEAVFSIGCGVTGGSIAVEVFKTINDELINIGNVYTINNVAGSLCPGDEFSSATTIRLAKSAWQSFSEYISTGATDVANVRLLGDIPSSGWLAYQIINNPTKSIRVYAAFNPAETLSKKYSLLFKSVKVNNSVSYNRVVIDYVAPPIISAPLASLYGENSPIGISKDETYTSTNPVFRITADNMQYSGEFPTDSEDFYYSASGLPQGLTLDKITGNVTGTVASSVVSGENIEIDVTAHNASGAAVNPQTIYLRVAIQEPPVISFDSSTPGPVFNISNFDLYTSTASIYKINSTNLPIYRYNIYPTLNTTALPAGLYFDASTGTITGKITETQSGTATFELTATNSYGESSSKLNFTLNYTIYNKPNITSPTSGTIITVKPSDTTTLESPLFTIAATQAFGGTDNYEEGLTDLTRNKYTSPPWNNVVGIPPGFILDLYTGKFYGKISSSALPTDLLITSYTLNYPIRLTATNPVGVATRDILLQVASEAVPVVNYIPPVTIIRGNTYTEQNPLFRITATNNPTSFSATGLPAGLSSTSSGRIIGSVSNSIPAGSYTVVVRASNENGTSSPFNCELRIPISIISVTPTAPYSLITGNTYSNIFTIATSELNTGEAISITTSSLPAGLNFSNNSLSGTPTARGTYTIRVTATTQDYGYALVDLGVLITSPVYNISGLILNDLNAPVSGVTVSVSNQLSGVSNADGTYVVSNVPVGVYNVKAEKPNCIVTPTVQRITVPKPSGSTQVDLNNVNFNCIGPVRTVIGKLLRISSQEPLAGLAVSDGYRSDVSDTFGIFELLVSYNTVTLSVTAQHYSFPTTVIPAGSAAVSDLIIYGTPVYTLSGTIFSESNIQGQMSVEVKNLTSGVVTTTAAPVSANSATYSLTLPAGGEHSIRAISSLNNYAFNSVSNFLLTNSRVINFTAAVVLSISGKVIASSPISGDTDIPIAGVNITIGGKSALTDASGVFSISGLVSGTYTIQAIKPGYSFQQINAVTIANTAVSNVIVRPSYYSISGAVYSADPYLKIAGASIKLRNASDYTIVRTVLADGQGYTINNVPTGEYVLYAEQAACSLALPNNPEGTIAVSDSNLSNKNFNITDAAGILPNKPNVTEILRLASNFRVTIESLITEGSPIVKYDYSLDDGSTWQTTAAYTESATFDIPNIVPNTQYNLKFKAYNLYGYTTSDTYTITSATVPTAPIISSTTTTPGGRGLVIYFTQSGSSSDLPVLKYEWRINNLTDPDIEPNWTAWIPTEPAIDSTSPITARLHDESFVISNGVPYYLQIRAINAVGAGEPSAYFYPAIASAEPSSPVNLIATAISTTEANLSFNIPDDGGSAILDIEYFLRVGSFDTAIQNPNYISSGISTTEYTVTELPLQNLNNGVTYTVQIRCTNVTGKSSWALLTFTKAWLPLIAPNVNIATPRAEGCDIVLNTDELSTSPNNGGVPIKSYKFFIRQNTTDTVVELSNGREFYRLQNLINNTEATVRVAAVNTLNFQGPLSASRSITPTPGAPASSVSPISISEPREGTMQIDLPEVIYIDSGGDTQLEVYCCISYPGVESTTVYVGAYEYSSSTRTFLQRSITLWNNPDIGLPVAESWYKTNAVDIIRGVDYSLQFMLTNTFGQSSLSSPVYYRLGLPGAIIGNITVTSKASGADVFIPYTYYDQQGPTDELTSIYQRLEYIDTDTSNYGGKPSVVGIYYSIKRNTDITYSERIPANLYIDYVIMETPNWPGETLQTADWPGEITNVCTFPGTNGGQYNCYEWPGEIYDNPYWLGENDGFGNYNLSAQRTLSNEGLLINLNAAPSLTNGGKYYDTNAVRTEANGGIYYNTSAVRTLENGGLLKDFSVNRFKFYADFSNIEVSEPYNIDLKIYAASDYGVALNSRQFKALRTPPTSELYLYNPTVGYNSIKIFAFSNNEGAGDNFGFSYSLNAQDYITATYEKISSSEDGSDYSITLPNIPQGTYLANTIKLRAINSSGAGPAKAITEELAIGTPAAPGITTIPGALGKLIFSITPPLDTGGAAIIGFNYYSVYILAGAEQRFTYTNTEGQVTWSNTLVYKSGNTAFNIELSNLPNYDVDFKIYVQAVNSRGDGPYGTLIARPIMIPGGVKNLQVEPGDRKATITWKSGFTGNLPGGFKLNNLTLAGTAYQYTAENQNFSLELPFTAGTQTSGNLSQYHAQATGLPQTYSISGVYSLVAPTISAVIAKRSGILAITLTITPPTGENWYGTNNPTYYYSMNKNSLLTSNSDVPVYSGPLFAPGPTTTHILGMGQEGILPNTTYFIRVRGPGRTSSPYTPGNYSEILEITVPPIPPEPNVSDCVVFVDYIELNISAAYATKLNYTIYNHPLSGGSNYFTGVIDNITAPGSIVLRLCKATINWLTFDQADATQLFVSISANNIVGTSYPTNYTIDIPPVSENTLTKLSPPVIDCVAEYRAISITIVNPTCGGDADTNYDYTYSLNNNSAYVPLSVTRIDNKIIGSLTNLQGNTAYTIKVRRSSTTRDSSDDSNSVALTTLDVAAAPTNLILTPGNNSINYTFTKPVTYGLPIVGYVYRIAGNTWKNLPITSNLSTTVTGTILQLSASDTALTNGTSYSIQFAAVCAAGDSLIIQGPNTASRNVTPCDIPSKILTTSIYPTLTDGKISLNISPLPSNGGSAITKYSYSLDDGANYTLSSSASLPLSITSWLGSAVQNAVTYQLKIRAVNLAGSGETSETIPIKIIVIPSAPIGLVHTNANRNVTLQFSPPSFNGGSEIINYEYSTNDGITFKALSPANPTPTVPGFSGLAMNITTVSTGSSLLVNGVPYVIKIRAVNIKGPGVMSTYVVGIPVAG